MKNMEDNIILKNKIISYLKEKINSGELTTIGNFEISSIINNTKFDENMNMYLIEIDIWNKLPLSIQEAINALSDRKD